MGRGGGGWGGREERKDLKGVAETMYHKVFVRCQRKSKSYAQDTIQLMGFPTLPPPQWACATANY